VWVWRLAVLRAGVGVVHCGWEKPQPAHHMSLWAEFTGKRGVSKGTTHQNNVIRASCPVFPNYPFSGAISGIKAFA